MNEPGKIKEGGQRVVHRKKLQGRGGKRGTATNPSYYLKRVLPLDRSLNPETPTS